MNGDTQTRGERNHNPFNLEGNYITWLGLAEPSVDNGGYCIFIADEFGLRAGFRDLFIASTHDGLNTIRSLVSHFAPPTDNDTEAYIAAVSQMTGIDPDAALDLRVAGVLQSLGRAFIVHENGRCIYTDQQLATAVQQAVGFNPGAAA